MVKSEDQVVEFLGYRNVGAEGEIRHQKGCSKQRNSPGETIYNRAGNLPQRFLDSAHMGSGSLVNEVRIKNAVPSRH